MNLHSVIISYNRPELLRRTVESYRATVTVEHTLLVVDNGSDRATRRLITELECSSLQLNYNSYPGVACNIGFEHAPVAATHLHRSDNDMEYLPGWCHQVEQAFMNPTVGQVGLRTEAEEEWCEVNVGGTAVFDRHLWTRGLRYVTDSWTELGSHTEDYWISQEVVSRGYRWSRVKQPCVVHLASGDLDDPYYQESYGIRGLLAEG